MANAETGAMAGDKRHTGFLPKKVIGIQFPQ
jgi:hypothetical protein